MAIETALITFDLSDYLGDNFDARRTKVWLTTNVPEDAIADTATGEVRIGGGSVTLADSGATEALVPIPGADTNPPTWQTTVHVDYVDKGTRERKRKSFGPYTITESSTLGGLIEEQVAIPTATAADYAAQAEAAVDSIGDAATVATTAAATATTAATTAEAAAAQAVDISNIDTPDSLVATLVSDSGSATGSALSASYADATLVGKKVTGFRGPRVYAPPPSGDHATDQASVQELVNLMSGLGGGAVLLTPAPTTAPYLLFEVVVPSNTQVRGAGELSTYVKAPNTAGVGHVFVSKNFATLTGTNAWLTSAGVPVRLGVSDMTVDGNKAGRALAGGTVAQDIANSAVALYGKALLADGLVVINSPGDGWYSECANGGGQTDETDLPEGYVGRVEARGNDGVGVHVRGPHDARWGSIVAGVNGRQGWLVEGDGATYNGTCDVDFCHAYANGQRYAALGRKNVPDVEFAGSGSGVRVSQLIAESGCGPGVRINAGNTWVGHLFTYYSFLGASGASNLDDTHYGVEILFQDTHVGSLRHYADATSKGSGVLVAGANTILGPTLIRGYGSNGVGLDIDANNVQAPSVLITGYSGTGGRAARINRTNGRAGTVLRGKTYDCATGLTAGVNSGTGNQYVGLDLDVHLAVEGTSAAQTAHALDANFLSSRPASSRVTLLPRGSAPTTGKVVFDTTGLTGAVNLDFPSIAAGGTADLTITVPGAQTGDTVRLGPPAFINAGLMWAGFVSAADTVTVRLHNTTAAAIDPALGPWRATVTR